MAGFDAARRRARADAEAWMPRRHGTHVPATQLWLIGTFAHHLSQAPQWLLSVLRSTPVLHVLSSQTSPCFTWHFAPQAPQCLGSFEVCHESADHRHPFPIEGS